MDLHHVNTFSICAVDTVTGEAGVAVASRYPAVGAIVPHAEAGIGAIATQAVCRTEFGPEGLALLRQGRPAEQVVQQLIEQDVTVTDDDSATRDRYSAEHMIDEGIDYVIDKGTGKLVWFTRRIRQVGVVDATGRASVHSGECIFPWFGSQTGDGFACQGNMLTGPEVVEAMASAFAAAREAGNELGQCLVSALTAGDNAGGDKRGKQAAALLVDRPRDHWPGPSRYLDLRVDDDPEPTRRLGEMVARRIG